MLTQFQTTEPQAAILAARPRPRALAAVSPAVAQWRSTERSAVSLRPCRPGIVAAPFASAGRGEVSLFTRVERRGNERGGRDYGYLSASVNSERTDAMTAAGAGAGSISTTGNFSTTSKQQGKQHLTARRGPVTWRPPH